MKLLAIERRLHEKLLALKSYKIFISLGCNKHKYIDGYTGIESEILIENNNQS